MNDKMLLMLAFDSLLLELDEEYEDLPEEVIRMIEAKVYESYGLEITSRHKDVLVIRQSLIRDARKYRDKLIKDITEEEY